MGEFEGRIAVVTGGSEGLGYDFCRALCAAGCEVYFCGLAAGGVAAAEQALGPTAHGMAIDVAEPEQIEAFAAQVAHHAGRVDYLVNNVATDERIAFDDLTCAACDRMWHVNLRSYLLMTRACLGLLRAGQGKAVVNLGTCNYMFALEPFTVYNASKSGIVGFTRSLAREMGREGIRANMISPGWIMTEKQLRDHVTEQDKADLLRDQALKFLMHEEHVTPVLMFLLSSAAQAVTGQNLIVDNGKFMQ